MSTIQGSHLPLAWMFSPRYSFWILTLLLLLGNALYLIAAYSWESWSVHFIMRALTVMCCIGYIVFRAALCCFTLLPSNFKDASLPAKLLILTNIVIALAKESNAKRTITPLNLLLLVQTNNN